MVSDNPDEWLKRRKEAQRYWEDEGFRTNDFYTAFDKMKEKYPDIIKNESRKRLVNAITESVIRRLRRK